MKKMWLLGAVMAFGAAAMQGWAQGVTLAGAGATFPEPLYTQRYFPRFGQEYGIKVTYSAIGSGDGIAALRQKRVNFAASDAPLTNSAMEDIVRETGSTVLHIPTALGAVAVIYNIPGVGDGLQLSSQLISDIYLGKITKWNDARIRQLNPSSPLPDLAITPTFRSDSSGTTFIFSAYLSVTSSEWLRGVGKGRSLKWPAGKGAETNDGVAALVGRTPGAIGYVDRTSITARVDVATIRNKAGNFIAPSTQSVSAALSGLEVPNDLRLPDQAVDTDNPQGYPIVGMTWILVYKKQEVTALNKEQAQAVVELLTWIVTSGQELNGGMRYASLPPAVARQARELINTITYNGQSLRL